MKFRFIDPDEIMQIIVALIVLGVGVFAFFVTLNNIPVTAPAVTQSGIGNSTYFAMLNASDTGNSVFNIVGVVMVIAAIMAIIGLVYSSIQRR